MISEKRSFIRIDPRKSSVSPKTENTGSGAAPRHTSTGKELDTTGLYYYGARYYDPTLCRFITTDTVYDTGPQGLNRYSYALNNPLRCNDPTGDGAVDRVLYSGWAGDLADTIDRGLAIEKARKD